MVTLRGIQTWEFIRALKNGWHKEIGELLSVSDELLKDTLSGKGEKVAAAVEKIHRIAMTLLFYNNERALRSVIQFAHISCIDEFNGIQELPSENRYADVVYLPREDSSMPIMVIELKWNKSAKGAIEQIKEQKYPEVFERYGSEILLVGINYDGKSKRHECMIEKYYR